MGPIYQVYTWSLLSILQTIHSINRFIITTYVITVGNLHELAYQMIIVKKRQGLKQHGYKRENIMI